MAGTRGGGGGGFEVCQAVRADESLAGVKIVTLKGERIAEEFQDIVENYVARSFTRHSSP